MWSRPASDDKIEAIDLYSPGDGFLAAIKGEVEAQQERAPSGSSATWRGTGRSRRTSPSDGSAETVVRPRRERYPSFLRPTAFSEILDENW
ncbi:MAG: hypothetical protein AB1665_03250 [Candidatus Thermoplasmatota archaeon]